MNEIIIPILSVITVMNVILGGVIFSRGIKKFTDILFGLIAFATALWSLAIIGFYSNQNFIDNWIALTHVSAICIAFSFFIFSYYFPREIVKNNKVLTSIALIVFTVISYFILFSDKIVGPVIDFSVFSYQIGPYYIFYGLAFILFFILGFIFIDKQYNLAVDRNEKKQVLYVFMGALISSGFAIIPDLLFPFFNIFQYTWTGPLFTLIMVVSIFLAITKYGLFDIKLIFTELISGAIIVLLLFEIFFVNSIQEVILKTVVLIVVSYFAYLLIEGVYREIEQRKKIEALAKDLDNANQQQIALIHFITHEVKGFLSKSRDIFSVILDEDHGPTPAYLKVTAQEGLKSGENGIAMVQEILNSANIKKGTVKYNMQPFDIKILLQEVLSEQKGNSIEKGLAVNLNIEDGEDYKITGDSEHIKHVLKNIVDNAIKYTLKGEVKVNLSKKDNKILFSVKDTGVGIIPEDKERLFTEGGKGKDSIRINPHSTGFGLFISKNIVEVHHGRIWAESAGAGMGSTFFVELPA
ncbi:MAG: ATP-binding protein [Candidatus Paceibacterota bacterium]